MHLGHVKEWGVVERFDAGGQSRTGNSRLGELVLGWLRSDLEERGPRKALQGAGQSAQGRTYESFEGKGGYGHEKRVEE